MTREEQINKEAYRQLKLVDMDVESFIAGAKWADANSKSPWISVDDKMPYEYPELLENRNTTIPVLTKTEWLGYFAQFMYYIETRKSWEFSKGGGVEYWMPIPKPPKE